METPFAQDLCGIARCVWVCRHGVCSKFSLVRPKFGRSPDSPPLDPSPADPPPPDRPKFRSFFFFPPLPPLFSFFLPLLGGRFVEFLVVRLKAGKVKCARVGSRAVNPTLGGPHPSGPPRGPPAGPLRRTALTVSGLFFVLFLLLILLLVLLFLLLVFLLLLLVLVAVFGPPTVDPSPLPPSQCLTFQNENNNFFYNQMRQNLLVSHRISTGRRLLFFFLFALVEMAKRKD